MLLAPPTPSLMTEYQLQVAAADFLVWALPDDIIFTHIPMGEKRDKATAGKLRAMGVNPGWPDFEILIPNGVTLRIEMKTERGRPSEPQQTFFQRAKVLGHRCYIARSVNQLQEILEYNGITLRARMT